MLRLPYMTQNANSTTSDGPEYCFEMGPIRPPNEGRESSLLIRVTRNCPWNRCEFCPTYKGFKFEYRGINQVKADITTVKAIASGLKDASWKTGYGGTISDAVIADFINNHSELYGKGYVNEDLQQNRLQSLINVANWLASGGTTVFLQDADSLIMRTPELVEILDHLKAAFPQIERITSYARARTLSKKTLEELIALHHAGLTRLHVGLESGCDDVLEYVQKGVTAREHVEAGIRVIKAGIELSEYVMPGLGGQSLSEKHTRDTVAVLNQIKPNFIRLRSLIVRHNTPLHNKLERGEFVPLSDDELIDEVRLLIELLNCSSYLVSDHMSNLLLELEGHLPEDKPRLLETIQRYQATSQTERLKFQLKRRLRSYLNVYGGLPPEIEQKVQESSDEIDRDSHDAPKKVAETINLLRDGFI